MHNIKLLDKSSSAKLDLSKIKKNMKKILPTGIFLLIILLVIGKLFVSFSKQSTPIDFIFERRPNINSTAGRVNILLLGNAGGTHEGAYLTDTIMVASINYRTHQTYLISLPRDLWVDLVKGKLNTVYERGGIGENGLILTKKVVGGILDIPIHYGIRVDFSGFVKAVNEIGGVDVDVERSFVDSLYPITGKENDLCGFIEVEKEFNEEQAKQLNIEVGKHKVLIALDGTIATDSAELDKGYEYFKCRYELISFEKGLTKMDGETALKFSRSRMGSNGEGSDFARSRRQQQVLEAFRKKVLSLETLVNPSKITSLVSIFSNSIEMDLTVPDMIVLFNLVKQNEGAKSFVISDQGTSALLVNPPVGQYGAWVLIPKGGSNNTIHKYVKGILSGKDENASASARPGN